MTSDDVNRDIEAAEPVEPDFEGCPATPLGMRRGVYFFVSPSGEFREFTFRELAAAGIESLMEGDFTWLGKMFAGATQRDLYGVQEARAWLIRKCSILGQFDPDMPVRELGVWKPADPNAPGLIAHLGRQVRWYRGGEIVVSRPGKLKDGALYTSAPAITAPSDVPATADDGKLMLRHFKSWRYRRGVDPELIVGWCAMALLGSAAPWRSHVIVTGRFGCGKTWLAGAVSAAMGDGAHSQANDYTRAGLQQKLQRQARPLILDEAESSAGPGEIGRVEHVVELLRFMSSGAGAKVLRGSVGGNVRVTSAVGAAYLSCILPPIMMPQDRSRFTSIELRALATEGAEVVEPSEVEAGTARLIKLSPAFRSRALLGYDRFLENLATWQRVLVGAGASHRDADQLASLLAGRDLMLSDETTVPDSAEREARGRLAALIEAPVLDERGDEGRQCLGHLLTSTVQSWSSGDQPTIAQMIIKAKGDDGDSVQARAKLAGLGMKIHELKDAEIGERVFLIANQNTVLDKIFLGTRWAGGQWGQALQYLDGVQPLSRIQKGAVWIEGLQVRTTALPMHYLPLTETEAAAAAEDTDIPF